MAITDPSALKFSNEQIRPLAEAARALKARIDAMMVDWYAGQNTLFVNSAAEVVDDGRAPEGISVLTGADVNNVVSQLAGVSLNTEIIAKPCVRPLNVTIG